jgi:hypothetical protein
LIVSSIITGFVGWIAGPFRTYWLSLIAIGEAFSCSTFFGALMILCQEGQEMLAFFS